MKYCVYSGVVSMVTPPPPHPVHGTRQECCSLNENPCNFFNRELSWIEFNRHVLTEAMDTSHPLLERVKFLSIFANNLDEFFMIRVSGLQRQVAQGVREAPPDGMTPSQQLDTIHAVLSDMLQQQSEVWHNDLVPALTGKGIQIVPYHKLDDISRQSLRDYFIREIFPVLTPLAFDKTHPFPFISNLSLNLAILLNDPITNEEFFARVKVPTTLFPRIIRIPGKPGHSGPGKMVFIEECVASNLDILFPGLSVSAVYPFRVTRDADLEIEEDEASDLLTAIEESVEMRRIGSPVRIEVDRSMPSRICRMIGRKLGIAQDMFYRVSSPLGMTDLMELLRLDRPDLKDEPFIPATPPGLEKGEDYFSAIRKGDILLFHPYDSFTPVIQFISQAAEDPDVLAIKITLYRVGANSPVVQALLKAREHGKAVAALIELKARFDEENNIGWARALEREGVHVVYGIVGLKVHAKVCMVVRKEKSGIVRYVHLGTGNYNATSSRVYTDLGVFTARDDLGKDATDLFNTLTGCSRLRDYRSLLVAPTGIRAGILSRIDREIEHHRANGNGRIIFKMNALVDRDCIAALYRASQAGVEVILQVRGICCLRPGVEGISDNVRVTSIVGRFLEHARIYYFHNGGDPEVFLGSADLMPRNLDRRVEVLFPVEDKDIKAAITGLILPVHLSDNTKARQLGPDGRYERVGRKTGEPACNAQEWSLSHRGAWQYEKNEE
jgi:polyphosphate kinase